jgi:Tfp pilus assembly protein PilO
VIVDNLTKLNAPWRNVLSGALVIITAIAMYNWILAPHVSYLFAVQRYEPVASNIANESVALRDSLDAKRGQLAQLRRQFTELRGALFTPRQAREFFMDIQNTAEKSGCTVTSASFTPDQAGPAVRQADQTLFVATRGATLSLFAPYDKIANLLAALQNRPQKVWIDSVSMELRDISSAQLECTITLTIYVVQNRETPSDV